MSDIFDAWAKVVDNKGLLDHLSIGDRTNALRCFAEATGSHLAFYWFIQKLSLDNLKLVRDDNI